MSPYRQLKRSNLYDMFSFGRFSVFSTGDQVCKDDIAVMNCLFCSVNGLHLDDEKMASLLNSLTCMLMVCEDKPPWTTLYTR